METDRQGDSCQCGYRTLEQCELLASPVRVVGLHEQADLVERQARPGSEWSAQQQLAPVRTREDRSATGRETEPDPRDEVVDAELLRPGEL